MPLETAIRESSTTSDGLQSTSDGLQVVRAGPKSGSTLVEGLHGEAERSTVGLWIWNIPVGLMV